MAMTMRCTNCGQALQAPDALAGKTVRCPGCGVPISIPSAADPPPPSSARTEAPGPASPEGAAGGDDPDGGAQPARRRPKRTLRKSGGATSRRLAAAGGRRGRGDRREPHAPAARAGGLERTSLARGVPVEITPGVFQELSGTRPWVLIVSVSYFIGALLCTVALALVLLFSRATGVGGSSLLLAVLTYGGGAGVSFLLGWWLVGYAKGIRAFVSSRASLDLERGLRCQRYFWLVTGILYLIGLVFASIAVVGMLIAVM